jgi:hypothetical protein
MSPKPRSLSGVLVGFNLWITLHRSDLCKVVYWQRAASPAVAREAKAGEGGLRQP